MQSSNSAHSKSTKKKISGCPGSKRIIFSLYYSIVEESRSPVGHFFLLFFSSIFSIFFYFMRDRQAEGEGEKEKEGPVYAAVVYTHTSLPLLSPQKFRPQLTQSFLPEAWKHYPERPIFLFAPSD